MTAASLASELAQRLQPWFRKTARPLTWRNSRDPYAIWVSEVMLQQTRVDTVERYYGQFLDRFPDVGTLAAADEDSVLSAWSGLGYYRRARLLHRGARHVHETLGGRLPNDARELQRIPGIGRYTAGAIASIAFDRPAPLVDGNVARVLSRIQAVDDPKAQDASAAGHWSTVHAILEQGSPRILAQALMELGATVCTPKAPRCLLCPVRDQCEANRRGLVEQIPAARKKIAQPTERLWALAVLWRGKVLLQRRPDQGLLAGMWCVPLLTARGKRLQPKQVQSLLGVPVEPEAEPGKMVKHVFTHRIWQLYPWVVRVRRKPKLGEGHAWTDGKAMPEGGVPNVTRKVLQRVGYGPR